jgi:hypothetical protein
MERGRGRGDGFRVGSWVEVQSLGEEKGCSSGVRRRCRGRGEEVLAEEREGGAEDPMIRFGSSRGGFEEGGGGREGRGEGYEVRESVERGDFPTESTNGFNERKRRRRRRRGDCRRPSHREKYGYRNLTEAWEVAVSGLASTAGRLSRGRRKRGRTGDGRG